VSIKQIIGILLLVIGISIISWTAWSSFEIFTNKKPAPEIFKQEVFQKETIQKESSVNLTPQEQISQKLQETLQEELSKMLPAGFMPKTMNLVAWSILAGILIFAGGKIASLGIQLL